MIVLRYEPVLAVSGIDHTIKIFSPDARAQKDARQGINGTVPRTTSVHSSLSGRRRRQATAPNSSDGLSSRKRMHDSYQIMSQNDAERQGGMREAFISVRTEGTFMRIQATRVDFQEWMSWFRN